MKEETRQGQEQEEFLSQIAFFNQGDKPLDKETVMRLKAIVARINRGEDKGGIPERWIQESRKNQETFEKMYPENSKRTP